jgi:DNA-directed RNA polymerase subunit RPC12/RpoP
METYKCLDCGHEWETEPTWKTQTCPNCGEFLDVTETTDMKL